MVYIILIVIAILTVSLTAYWVLYHDSESEGTLQLGPEFPTTEEEEMSIKYTGKRDVDWDKKIKEMNGKDFIYLAKENHE